MGYKDFSFGDKLDPAKFNIKFSKIFELIKKAYEKNNKLRDRIEVLNTAFSYSNTTITNAADPFQNASNIYKHNPDSTTSGTYEMQLGGRLFTAQFSGPTYTWISMTDLQYLGNNLILGESAVINRIPLVDSDDGEKEPSIGVDFTVSPNVFNENNLWMILGTDTIWAEEVADPGSNVAIGISVPSTLSPKLNHVRAVPLLDVAYELEHDKADGSFTSIISTTTGYNDFYMDATKFANNFKLTLTGNTSGNLKIFGFSSLEAYYRSFVETGEAVIKITLNGTTSDEKLLTGLSVNAQNATGISLQVSDQSDFSSIKFNSATDSIPFSGSIALGTAVDFYVKVIFNKINDTTPALSKINLTYEVV